MKFCQGVLDEEKADKFLAIKELRRRMLTEQTAKFAESAAALIPAIRIDCGWNPRTCRAFFNEFSPPPPASTTFARSHPYNIIPFMTERYANTIIDALHSRVA